MKTVNATFRRMNEVCVQDCLNTHGVYVLWRGRNRKRPADIGQGSALKRILAKHRRTGGFDGLMAMMEGGRRTAKHHAVLVEALLLSMSKDINLWPTEARQNGHMKKVRKTVAVHRKLRVNIRGYDPFLPPRRPKMARRKQIEACFVRGEDGLDSVQINGNWNKR